MERGEEREVRARGWDDKERYRSKKKDDHNDYIDKDGSLLGKERKFNDTRR